MLDDSEIERILVVTAHPDDLDFAAAGTIANWTEQGIEVSYCVITNGDAGGFDPEVPRRDIPGIRQAEQRAAGAVLGVHAENIHFLDYHDGKLQPTHQLRRDITRVIRQVRPQRVLCQAPERDYTSVYASHPDHLAAGEAALCAVYPDSRNPFAHPELLLEEGWKEWTVPEIWIMTMNNGNHAVDITERFGQKLEALWSHTSQYSHDRDFFEGHLREMGALVATEAGFGETRLAERFRVMDTK